MEKLIVVGMRHCDAWAMGNYASKTIVGKHVRLREVKNNAGVDGRAIEVALDGSHIGYIRNADLPQAFKVGVTNSFWTIDKHCEYYLALKPYKIEGKLEVKLEANPCKEIHLEGVTTSLLDSTPIYNSTYSSITNKETKMINTNSMRDQFFREVKNVAIDIQTGKFGIKNADGICVFTDGGINVNPIQELGLSIPAFAMRVAVDQLKAGDIVISSNDASFFVEATKNGYKTINTKGELAEVGTVTNMFFGKNSVLAVKNMFEGSGSEGMNPMMLAMMMGGEGSGKMDTKTLMLMSMMGGMGGAGGMNPMMLAMMMADK